MESLGKMKAADYWHWRFLIAEMQHAETKVKVTTQQYALMEKEVELAKMRATLFRDVINTQTSHSKDAKAAYDEYKLELEKKLGYSLSGCVIDDVTFEVSKLEE